MAGPIELTGKAMSEFITAMAKQPLALALAVISFALILLVYYQSSLFDAQRSANVALFIDIQKETQKLLSQCIVPAPERRPPAEDKT